MPGLKTSCTLLLLPTIFAILPSAPAQSVTPKVEIYGGYDYIYTSFAANNIYSSSSVSRNGGSVQVEYNASRRLGIVGDAGVYVTKYGAGTISYLLGPRLNLRHDRITPFVQVLAGGLSVPKNSFAMAIGGGVDCKVSRHIAIRPGQAEYLFTTLPDGGSNRQNGFRFSSGIVFRVGGERGHSAKS